MRCCIVITSGIYETTHVVRHMPHSCPVISQPDMGCLFDYVVSWNCLTLSYLTNSMSDELLAHGSTCWFTYDAHFYASPNML